MATEGQIEEDNQGAELGRRGEGGLAPLSLLEGSDRRICWVGGLQICAREADGSGL